MLNRLTKVRFERDAALAAQKAKGLWKKKLGGSRGGKLRVLNGTGGKKKRKKKECNEQRPGKSNLQRE